MTTTLLALACGISVLAAIGLHRRRRRTRCWPPAGSARPQDNAAQLELLRAAMTHVSDGVLITEADPLDEPGPRIVYVNPALERISGYAAADLLGRSPRFLQGPGTERAALDRIRSALTRAEPVTEEVLNYRPDGTPYWINLAIVPLAFNAAHVTHFVAVQRDVTGLRRLLRELEESRERYRSLLAQLQDLNIELEQRVQARTRELAAINAELEAFAFSVSHDLRAPLRGIGGFADVLRRHGRLDDQGQHYLDRISAATERMHTLIDALLELSRASSGPLRAAPLRLDRMAGQILRELARAEPQREVDWEVSGPARAVGDPELLRAALTNLLGNAWKFTRNRAPARIRVGAGDSSGTLVVEDNGIGFDPARAPDLFQPFVRLHDTSEYPGTGIGLALVQRIATRHGGEVRGAVLPEGGTRFTLRLPVAAADTQATEESGDDG